MSIESCQTQIHIYIDSASISYNSNNEALKIFSNLYSALIKNFLSHLEMRMHRMALLLLGVIDSLLTGS